MFPDFPKMKLETQLISIYSVSATLLQGFQMSCLPVNLLNLYKKI